jgi:hypothetical protein
LSRSAWRVAVGINCAPHAVGYLYSRRLFGCEPARVIFEVAILEYSLPFARGLGVVVAVVAIVHKARDAALRKDSVSSALKVLTTVVPDCRQ